jgi:hypothetical protein
MKIGGKVKFHFDLVIYGSYFKKKEGREGWFSDMVTYFKNVSNGNMDART